MREKLLEYLRCPDCRKDLNLTVFDAAGDEIASGLLHCSESHFFPVVRGVPRMLPSSLADNWHEIEGKVPEPVPPAVSLVIGKLKAGEKSRAYDTRTKANFSNEWDNHDIGGRTWTMELKDRVRWFFLDPIRIPREDLRGKVMLDAGCGNGSQSVAYTGFGLEVLAVDLSTGLEKGYAFRDVYKDGNPENVHFIQGDLQRPPLAENIVDIIHSAGVLHHTPDTETTFRALRPILKKGGVFYVWLYKYENVVTPIVNTMRAVTTRLPAPVFAAIAELGAYPFMGFCWAVDKLGIRQYEMPDRREAIISVHDIFGAPYAHYHSFDEVAGWFRSTGINEIWPCNDGRRGFGVCGRADEKSAAASS